MGFLINFGVFQNWWSFCEIFRMGLMKMTFKHHALHHMCIITLHLGRAHDVFTIVYHMLMHFSYIRTFNSLYFDKLIVLVLFCMSLFPPLSFFLLVASWHLNENLLHLGTLFIPGHPLLLTPLPFMSGAVMRRPNWTSLRTFLDIAFIRMPSHLVGLLRH